MAHRLALFPAEETAGTVDEGPGKEPGPPSPRAFVWWSGVPSVARVLVTGEIEVVDLHGGAGDLEGGRCIVRQGPAGGGRSYG
jgi:hypothetical protein